MSETSDLIRGIDIVNSAGVRAVAPGTRALTTDDYWQAGDRLRNLPGVGDNDGSAYIIRKTDNSFVGVPVLPAYLAYMPTGSFVREFDRIVVERAAPVSATNIVSLLRTYDDMRPLVPGRDVWQNGDRYWQRAPSGNEWGLDGWWVVVGAEKGGNGGDVASARPGNLISITLAERFPYGYKAREMMPANLNASLSDVNAGVLDRAGGFDGLAVPGIVSLPTSSGIVPWSPPFSGIVSAFGPVLPARGAAPGTMFTNSQTTQSYVWTGKVWALLAVPIQPVGDGSPGSVPTDPIPPVAPAPTETRRRFSL